jgi:BTB/POZ domain
MLYRVHRYFFLRDSAYFRDLVKGDLAGGPTVRPFMLNNITGVEFDAFLSILYPS